MSRHPLKLSTAAQWRTQFIDIGLSDARANVLSRYAGKLSSRDLPAIFSFHHFCLLLGVTPDYLASVVFSPQSHYRRFLIPKRAGGVREVVAPYPTLLECQRWICQNILSRSKIDWAAHGYVSGRGIISNATPHLGKDTLLKIDLKDFFPSIPISRVVGYFRSLGYAQEIAYFLARVCCLDDSLPQGAATSPALSNVLLRHMDRRLVGLSRRHSVTYTRYADDLAFSSEEISRTFIEDVDGIISDSGFTINPKKKVLISAGRRKILAGVDISSGKLRVPREFRRQVRLDAHLAMKLGAVEYIIQRRRNPAALPELAGKLAYWLQVEPDNAFALLAFERVREMCKNETGKFQ